MATYFLVPILTTMFFIEAFRAFVPGIYAAMYHVVFADPGWIGSLFTLLTLALLFIPLFTNKLCKVFGKDKMYILSITVIAIARVLMALHISSILETILAGIIMSFYGIFATLFLKQLVQNELNLDLKAKLSFLSITFFIAFLIDMTLRTVGFSSDITLVSIHLSPELWTSLQYIWLVIQIPLSVVLIIFTLRTKSTIFPESPKEIEEMRNGPWIINATGIGMVFFLLFNVLLYPNAIAEYTNTSYGIINPILIGGTTLLLIYILFGNPKLLYNLKINLCFNLILVLALAGFVFLGTTWNYPVAILTALSVALILLDFHLLITNASIPRISGNQIKSLSKFFTYGFLFFVIMTVFHVFSTDYAFTITAFKGLGPLILFIGGILLVSMTVLAQLQLNKFKEGGSI